MSETTTHELKSVSKYELDLLQAFMWQQLNWKGSYGNDASKVNIDYDVEEGFLVTTNETKKRRLSRLKADITHWADNQIVRLESQGLNIATLILDFQNDTYGIKIELVQESQSDNDVNTQSDAQDSEQDSEQATQ